MPMTTTERVLLEARNVKKDFDGLLAVGGVSYQVRQGEVAGIIGPNGAGKSTFFNLLTGLFYPSEGQIVYNGRDVTNVPPYERVALGMVRTFQLVAIFDTLTILDNLVLANVRFSETYRRKGQFFLWNAHRREIEAACRNALGMVGVSSKAHMKAAKLSYGDKRKLEIAAALSLNPTVLLLDEPFAGLSDAEIDDILELIHQLKRNFTIILIEHKISKIVDLVERLSVMHEGRLIANGKPADILVDPEVRRVYWGERN